MTLIDYVEIHVLITLLITGVMALVSLLVVAGICILDWFADGHPIAFLPHYKRRNDLIKRIWPWLD